MSIIKTLRKKHGYTQKDLAQKTGLSLRTIQRLETESTDPSGHSLQVLSKAFKVEPFVLQGKFLAKTQTNKTDKNSIKLINLSALAFIGIPFGNIILPYILWTRRKESELVDESGRRIINFQIIWSLCLCLLLCLSPLVNRSLPFSFPVSLLILIIAFAINVIVIFTNAFRIQNDKTNLVTPSIRLF